MQYLWKKLWKTQHYSICNVDYKIREIISENSFLTID